jgi:hypothetical protein
LLLLDVSSNVSVYIRIDYLLHQSKARFSVANRPSSELIQSLRVTLQRLEENFASPEDQPRIVELKHILLVRIADLEFVGAAVEKTNAEEAKTKVHLSLDEDGSDAT